MATKKKTEQKTEAKNEEVIVLKPINTKTMTVTIRGDSDLILNKMNLRNFEDQMDKQSDKSKTVRERNAWEDYITALHWRDELPENIEYTEETFKDLLKNNAPCISAYGMKKSIGDSVVRNELDKNKTKMMACINIIAPGGLIPIRYAEHHCDAKLIKPPMGKIVLSRQSRFSGWTASFTVQYIDGGTFNAEQILQAINLAGFGIGIGSGRPCGFGRYHIESVE